MMMCESMFGGELAQDQYLAEGMCARQARRDGVRFDRTFWRSPKWRKLYRAQMVYANVLLNTFSLETIVAALRTEKGRQVYSLGLRSVLVPLIKQLEQEKAVAEATNPTFVVEKNLLQKLKDL